jgi:hypothetical protein
MNKEELGSGDVRILKAKITYMHKQVKILEETGGKEEKIIKYNKDIKQYEEELRKLERQ